MISRDDILKLTGKGLFVFRQYIPGDWVIGRNFRNPLYHDKVASCRIFLSRDSNVYMMHDHGNTFYSGDCFGIVGKINGYDSQNSDDFKKILEIINRDMSLGLENGGFKSKNGKQKSVKRQSTPIQESPLAQPKATNKSYSFSERPFTTHDLEFWGRYGIDEVVLRRYRVVSIADFSSITNAGKSYWISAKSDELVFGYVCDSYIKIYRPLGNMRFSYGGNTPEIRVFGLSQLPAKGDILFITGGEKDVMSLSANGFNAISFNSETQPPAESVISRLTHRFKHIVILYDADETGKVHSQNHQQRLSEYGVMQMQLPLRGDKEEKDISDFFRLGNTAGDLRRLFSGLLRSRYSNTISILNSCKVSFKLPPPPPEIIISINDVPLGTNGNLLCVTGGEGTGKSNFVGALIAGAIASQGRKVDTLGVTIKYNSRNLPIILYDTEQSESQVFKNGENLIRRAGCEGVPTEFYPYSFTSLSREVRLRSIIESLDLFFHQFGGVHLVIIDGIADLISGANNETESIAVVEKLYRLASIYNTCIVCVLHFIPNGLKLRGHLGSELQRKAAAIVSIERDGDTSISLIKALKVRDGSPLDVPIIKFSWNKEKMMHCYIGEKQKSERKKVELKRGATDIFSKRPLLTLKELIEEVETYFDIKDRAARNYIDNMKSEGYIIESPSSTNQLMLKIDKSQDYETDK